MTESYTDDEIIGFYRDGKDDPHILEKLSDLACKPKGEVVSLLHRHGLMLDRKRPDEPSRPLHRRTAHTEDAWRKAIALRLAGESWSRIERETGREEAPDIGMKPCVRYGHAAEPLLTVDFRVTGTKGQLMMLKQFLKDNRISYGKVV